MECFNTGHIKCVFRASSYTACTTYIELLQSIEPIQLTGAERRQFLLPLHQLLLNSSQIGIFGVSGRNVIHFSLLQICVNTKLMS